MRHSVRLTLAAIAIGTIGAAAEAPDDVETVLARIGERIGDYYQRAQNVMCIEKYTVQPLGATSFGVDGLARTTESELRIETDAEDADGDGSSRETKVLRVIRKINGRAPRESDKDKRNTAGCTDPNPLSAEPLEFLLPSHRGEYVFTLVGRGKGRDRDRLLIDFKSVPTRVKPELIEAENGKEDCYGSKGDIPSRGRVWVDAESFDVMRVDEHVVGPVDIRVPEPLRRKRNLNDYMVIERLDRTMRFKKIAFNDPDEVMLLPEAIDETMLWRGGMQSTRRSHTFSDYRRFVTGARLVK
jgi:hypothetical protein